MAWPPASCRDVWSKKKKKKRISGFLRLVGSRPDTLPQSPLHVPRAEPRIRDADPRTRPERRAATPNPDLDPTLGHQAKNAQARGLKGKLDPKVRSEHKSKVLNPKPRHGPKTNNRNLNTEPRFKPKIKSMCVTVTPLPENETQTHM